MIYIQILEFDMGHTPYTLTSEPDPFKGKTRMKTYQGLTEVFHTSMILSDISQYCDKDKTIITSMILLDISQVFWAIVTWLELAPAILRAFLSFLTSSSL